MIGNLLNRATKFIFSLFSFLRKGYKFQISGQKFLHVMHMKNTKLDREFDKLVEGRTKKLDRANLKEELDGTYNV